MYKNFPSLAEAFLNYFDVDLAVTPRQIKQVEQLRYRVYCREFGYEPAENFPDKRERDDYDSHSLHCLFTHKRSSLPAGCVRLVCASDKYTMPIEDYCGNSVHLEYHEVFGSDRNELCEISRLAVDRNFRKRLGEDHTRMGEYDAMDCCHQEQRTFSLIGIACLLSAFALADISDRNHLFGMMETNLARLLRRAGLLVIEAGEPMDYHGERTPYFITGDRALGNVRDDLMALYNSLHQKLASDFSSELSVSVA